MNPLTCWRLATALMLTTATAVMSVYGATVQHSLRLADAWLAAGEEVAVDGWCRACVGHLVHNAPNVYRLEGA